jgi:A/G-specific adenine glycosylase
MAAPPRPPEPSPLAAARKALRSWYEPRREAYPWRRGPVDPYRVLVTEVMAQQTQARRVAAAFGPFLDRFPTVETLASASRADVVRAWANLGYNRRAIALHEAARAIVRTHAGRVPRDADALVALPGVGPYTAAAVASIAFGAPVAAVDTNARRVIARAGSGLEPDEIAPGDLDRAALAWLDPGDPGLWNQAVMDLGRVVCRPRAPLCDVCPLRPGCEFVAAGRTARGSSRPSPVFDGSSRQARGAVVRALRTRGTLTHGELASSTGLAPDRVDAAIDSLIRDEIVQRSRGRLRLHRG